MVTSISERPTKVEPRPLEEEQFGLKVAVWILVIAVAALAAWVVVDQVAESRTALTGEIQALLDDYAAAWNENDGDAFLALVTDDYEFASADGSTTARQQATMIDNGGVLDWTVEIVGEPIMHGDGPWFVAQANQITALGYPAEGYQGMSLVTIVEEDGTLLIQSHAFAGRG